MCMLGTNTPTIKKLNEQLLNALLFIVINSNRTTCTSTASRICVVRRRCRDGADMAETAMLSKYLQMNLIYNNYYL